MIIAQAEFSAELVAESASGVLTEATEEARAVVLSAFRGHRLVLTEAEADAFDGALSAAQLRLRQLAAVRNGILTEADERESLAFVESCAAEFLAESGVEAQLERWKDEVSKAQETYVRMVTSKETKEELAGRKGIMGLLLGLIGAGVGLVLAATGITAMLILGVLALLVGLGAMLWHLFQASFLTDDAEKIGETTEKVKHELRSKAKRILPQLDAIERTSQSKTVQASVQALRSQLEAVAVEEELEHVKFRKHVSDLATSAASDARLLKMEMRRKGTDLERRVKHLEVSGRRP